MDICLAYARVKAAINNKSLVCGQVVDIGLHVELSWATRAATALRFTQDRTLEISFISSIGLSNIYNFSKGLLIRFSHWEAEQ